MRLENDMNRIKHLIEKKIFHQFKKFNHKRHGSFRKSVREKRPILRRTSSNAIAVDLDKNLKLRPKFSLDLSNLNIESSESFVPITIEPTNDDPQDSIPK